MDFAAPALEILSRPAALLDAAANRVGRVVAVYRENTRLAEENERLLGWQQAAIRLASENAELRELLRLAPEPTISYVTARVIAASGGPFARSVVVNAGRRNGVTRGQAAVTGDGLVGRVSEVGERTARILLITDLNSRVPVMIQGSRQRAILVGDNSERPSLRFIDADAATQIGDRVATSGQGGVFPPGLPVGVVTGFDGGPPRIDPYAALQRTDYLRLLDYGQGGALPDPPTIASRGGRRAELSDGGAPVSPH